MKKKIIKIVSIVVQLHLFITSIDNFLNDGPIWYSIFLWLGLLLYMGGYVIKWVQKNIALDKEAGIGENKHA